MTLRCVCEDLSQDWVEPNDQRTISRLRGYIAANPESDLKDSSVAGYLRMIPPLARLRHPLIQAFDEQFAGADDGGLLRETISAVSDRQWFKQAFSARWRGAAVLQESNGRQTAWLGAAGYHRAGSREDFYEWFAEECSINSDSFIPAREDEVVERVDRKIAQLDAWKLQLHITALALLASALSTGAAGPVRIGKPEEPEVHVLDLSIAVDSIEVSGEVIREVTVVLAPSEWKFSSLGGTATRTILAAVEPRAEAWTSAPLQGAVMSHAALLSDESMREAQSVATTGELVSRVPGDIRLGVHAHYARVDRLTSSTIEGEAVQAICGYWFVPMHDHEGREVCAICATAHEELPE